MQDIETSLESVLPTAWASSSYGQQTSQQPPGAQQAGMQSPYDPSAQAHTPYGNQDMYPAPNSGYYYGPPGANIGRAGSGAYYYTGNNAGVDGGYNYGAQGDAHNNNMHIHDEPENMDDMYDDDYPDE